LARRKSASTIVLEFRACTKVRGTHLRQKRAQRLRSHAGLLDLSMHFAQQDRAHRLQRFVGDAGKRRIVGRLLAAINVPVSVGSGMSFGPGGNRLQQGLQALFGIDLAEVSAMGAQPAKKRFVVRSRALADDRNAETRGRRRPGRHRRLQTVGIIYRRLAKGIQLVGTPEMRR
jgi:hypothetical protein